MKQDRSFFPDQESDEAFLMTKERFRRSIVWTPLPFLTWLIPAIGHLGIATNEGLIHDFAGPYYVNTSTDGTAFGSVAKYYQVELADITVTQTGMTKQEAWDLAIEEATCVYHHKMHDLICTNCHSHVANALNRVSFKNFRHWNTLFLILFMVSHGKFVSLSRFLVTYAGLIIILSLLGIVTVLRHI